jgi:hypothetical protein
LVEIIKIHNNNNNKIKKHQIIMNLKKKLCILELLKITIIIKGLDLKVLLFISKIGAQKKLVIAF